ncbi:MAG: sterol desaturase family protein [Bacteroidia bacterium]|nr:sterol desaturase family protein [Bacteroidia bacterium]
MGNLNYEIGKVNTRDTGRVFKNPVLEFLTKTHPLIIIGMWVPICSVMMWYDHSHFERPLWQVAAIFGGAYFFWTFAEYFLHRYLYHWTNGTKWADRFHYMMHGIHHNYPNDKTRLFQPPVMSVILGAIFFSFFFLVLPGHTAAFSFFPGFTMGYLTYASIHYSIHAFKFKKGYFKWVSTHHNLHHFKYPDKAFGVSTPIWDFIMGTMPPRETRGAARTNQSN